MWAGLKPAPTGRVGCDCCLVRQSEYLVAGSLGGCWRWRLGRWMFGRFRWIRVDDCPASQVTDHHIAAAYDDLHAARELADRSDVVTYEFENVDATAIEVISGVEARLSVAVGVTGLPGPGD